MKFKFWWKGYNPLGALRKGEVGIHSIEVDVEDGLGWRTWPYRAAELADALRKHEAKVSSKVHKLSHRNHHGWEGHYLVVVGANPGLEKEVAKECYLMTLEQHREDCRCGIGRLVLASPRPRCYGA